GSTISTSRTIPPIHNFFASPKCYLLRRELHRQREDHRLGHWVARIHERRGLNSGHQAALKRSATQCGRGAVVGLHRSHLAAGIVDNVEKEAPVEIGIGVRGPGEAATKARLQLSKAPLGGPL